MENVKFDPSRWAKKFDKVAHLYNEKKGTGKVFDGAGTMCGSVAYCLGNNYAHTGMETCPECLKIQDTNKLINVLDLSNARDTLTSVPRVVDQSKLSVFGKWFHHINRDHGSFFESLFVTFIKGSGGNREKIVKAFPGYFNEVDINLDYK